MNFQHSLPHLPSHVAAQLDLDTLELTHDSFVDETLREHFSDLLFVVALRGGFSFDVARDEIYILLRFARSVFINRRKWMREGRVEEMQVGRRRQEGLRYGVQQGLLGGRELTLELK